MSREAMPEILMFDRHKPAPACDLMDPPSNSIKYRLDRLGAKYKTFALVLGRAGVPRDIWRQIVEFAAAADIVVRRFEEPLPPDLRLYCRLSCTCFGPITIKFRQVVWRFDVWMYEASRVLRFQCRRASMSAYNYDLIEFHQIWSCNNDEVLDGSSIVIAVRRKGYRGNSTCEIRRPDGTRRLLVAAFDDNITEYVEIENYGFRRLGPQELDLHC